MKENYHAWLVSSYHQDGDSVGCGFVEVGHLPQEERMASNKQEGNVPDSAQEKFPSGQAKGQGAQAKIRWDDSNMRSAYANVCNVQSTQEEVVLMFGLNQAWNAAQRELTVQLSDRIILSPFAAKRLALLLSNVMEQYESRFGKINIEARRF